MTLAELSKILNVNPSTLRTHLNRFDWRSEANLGQHSQFTQADLMVFASAYALFETGYRLEIAFRLAARRWHERENA